MGSNASALESARVRCAEYFNPFADTKLKPNGGQYGADHIMWELLKQGPKFDDLGLREGEYRVDLLGSGEMGGSVFLISSPTQKFEPYVLKSYKKTDVFNNDLRAFELLKEVVGENNPYFKIPNVEVVMDRVMKFEYIPGETVELMNDRLEGDKVVELSRQITKRFEAGVNYVVELFVEKYADSFIPRMMPLPGATTKYYSFEIIPPGHLSGTKIFLKADNFLVDSRTNELWLIDPY